ncbi:phage gp6-like head-tail connector protein [Sphingomonas sp. C8-2]|nr:phage gp6-like head-tail connector protein [Sphingomonas sp. C8-2]
MRVIVVTPPDPVVSYAEAVARLRLRTNADEQEDVEAMIAAATAMFNGPGGWLGRAIGAQTLELRCDRFTDPSGGALRLPYRPIIALLNVKYLDRDGIEQSIPLNDCELIGDELVPAYGKAWPVTLPRREAVRVQYSAGDDVVDARIKAAILLAVGDMYRFRETISLSTVDKLPSAASITELLGTSLVFG